MLLYVCLLYILEESKVCVKFYFLYIIFKYISIEIYDVNLFLVIKLYVNVEMCLNSVTTAFKYDSVL